MCTTKIQPKVKHNSWQRLLFTLFMILFSIGILAQLVQVRAEEDEEATRLQTGDRVTVERGDFLIEREIAPSLYLPKQDDLLFEYENATLGGIYVRHGDLVQEGDVLFTFIRQEDLAASEERRIRLEETERQADQQISSLREELEALRADLDQVSDAYSRQRTAIEIEIAEETLRWQEIQSNKAIAAVQDEIEQAAARDSVTELVAPYDGQVINLTGRRVGDRLNAWEYMCRIVGQEPFLLEVENRTGEFRQGSTVVIEYGPARSRESLTATVVADHSLLSPDLVDLRAWLAVEGISPADAASAVNPRVKANSQLVSNVLVVPRSAVIRQNQDYYVNLQTESGLQRRYIEVVNWNSDDYWVLTGIAEGDVLVIE